MRLRDEAKLLAKEVSVAERGDDDARGGSAAKDAAHEPDHLSLASVDDDDVGRGQGARCARGR
jgi:hypothetical protein